MALKPTPSRRPIIPLPASADTGIRRAFDTVANLLAASTGETQTIVHRVMVSMGLAQETKGGTVVAGDGVVPNMKVPPVPTGLVTTPGFRSVVLRCDTYYPFYLNHGIMEVWRSLSDDLATALPVNSAPGFTVTDIPPEAEPGTPFFYWIRFVSSMGVVGPFNAVEGVAGQTSVDAGYVLSLLAGEILSSHLATSLSERIDLIDSEGGLVDIAADQGFAIDGLSGQYTAKIDNNGFVTGFGLASTAANGAALSEFYALVDRFAIINPAVSPKTITITRVDATATAASTAHGFAANDYVVIVGAAQPEYNGTQKILTVPDVDSFTFAVSGSPATPATIDTANGYTAIRAAGAKVPFIVQDGVVYIDVAMIGELSADIITSGELNAIDIIGSTITGSKLQTTVGDSQIVMCDGGNINGYNYSSDTLAFIQGGITKYILHTAGIRGTVELLGSIITLPFVAPSGNTTCTAEMNTGSVSANSKGALYGKGSSVFQAFAGTGYDGSNYNYSTGVIAEGAWPLQIVPGATTSPSHPAKIGTLWVSSAGKLYINTNGSTTWAVVGSQS